MVRRALTLAVTGLFAVAGSASAATVSWSGPALIDAQQPFATTPEIRDVACPSSHLCVGLEDSGVVTATNPTAGQSAWQPTSLAGLHGYSGAVLVTLSCPSTHFCAAADFLGDLLTSTNPTGGAASWKASRVPFGGFYWLSCVNATLCFGSSGTRVMFSRTPTRPASWHAVSPDGDAGIGSISCPTAHLCAAIATTDLRDDLVTSTNPTGGPRSWKVRHVAAQNVNLAFSSIACPTVHLCIATDGWGNVFTSTHPERDRWSLGELGNFDARNLSCPTTRLCVAVSVAGVASSTNPSGGIGTWTVSPLPAPLSGVAKVGCAPMLCVAGDYGDNVLVSGHPAAGAGAWTRTNLGHGYNSIESVSCPDPGLCVAGDDSGNILSSTNPAGGSAAWSATALPVNQSGKRFDISSLSCPSSSLCVATAPPSILTSTDPAGGPGAWAAQQLQDTRSATAVSCPSSQLCVAGESQGNVLVSTDPTGGAGTWNATMIGTQPVCDRYGCNYDSILGVSCASAQLCAATDGTSLWVSTDPAGGIWTKSSLPFNGHVLTCPTNDLCVVGSVEQLAATTNPSSASPNWVVTHLPTVTGTNGVGGTQNGSVSGVSCVSTQLCVAVDNVAGYAFSGNPTDPSSWTATKVGSPLVGVTLQSTGLTGVSCPASGPCIAVDALGNAYAGQVTG